MRGCVRTQSRTEQIKALDRMESMSLTHLSSDALLLRLRELVAQDRGVTADLIEHLGEVDRREIVIDAGHPSLFDYCVKVLRYSEAAAFLRIRAARAAAKFPRILEDLRSGTIHLDAIMRLYPHLSEENSDALLTQASGASKREVQALVAWLGGETAPERDVVRWHPPSKTEATVAAPEEASPMVIPPARIRLSFTADDEFLRKVERLRGLRRHKFPEGRLEDLLNESVEQHLSRLEPRITKRAAKKPPSGRRIPAAVKAAVWERDEARCTYIAQDGRRCESREFLEFDHIRPWSMGGRSELSNVRLLCRPHNQRLGRRQFGPRRRGDRASVRPNAVKHGS